MEFKDLSNAIKEVKATEDGMGIFSGWAAYYNNTDSYNDVIDPGAFTRTMKAQDYEIPVCWQHDLRTPIGVGKLVDEAKGLKIEGTLYLDTAMGRQAYDLMKPREGFKRAPVRGLSIGFETIKSDLVDEKRHLKEIKLYEVSAVTIGANPRAVINTVKAAANGGPEWTALANVLSLVVQDIQDIKATLVDQGILNDPQLLHSLKALQDAGLSAVISDSLNAEGENDPNSLDEHSLEQLRDAISEFKRVISYGGAERQDGDAGGSQGQH